MSEYEHVVYGTARALIRNPDGSVREATPEEMGGVVDERYRLALEMSFKVLYQEGKPA